MIMEICNNNLIIAIYSCEMRTCKLPVPIASATKPGDYFPIRLEDEDAARLVIHHDDVPIAVHRHSFGPHQLS